MDVIVFVVLLDVLLKVLSELVCGRGVGVC